MRPPSPSREAPSTAPPNASATDTEQVGTTRGGGSGSTCRSRPSRGASDDEDSRRAGSETLTSASPPTKSLRTRAIPAATKSQAHTPTRGIQPPGPQANPSTYTSSMALTLPPYKSNHGHKTTLTAAIGIASAHQLPRTYAQVPEGRYPRFHSSTSSADHQRTQRQRYDLNCSRTPRSRWDWAPREEE